MTFDIDNFKRILGNQIKEKKLSALTASGYIKCVESINAYIDKNGGDAAMAIDAICNGNQQGNKYISAVKKYERDVMEKPKSILYGSKLQNLRTKYKQAPIGRELQLKEDTYLRKINAIRNETLKLALRLQLKSGLRISEIADLVPEDIKLLPDTQMQLIVRAGKNSKYREVNVMNDKYLHQHIKKLLETKSEGENLFYSAQYLKKKAGELNLQTHDLRRLNSRERFREQRGSGSGRRQARKTVQHELGHTAAKITNAYLGNEWNERSNKDENDATK